MRTILAAVTVLAATCGSAFADCKSETTLPGFIKAKKTQERSFTLSNPGAAIYVVTDSIHDRLYVKVLRPNGKVVCPTRGPAANLSCAPEVGGRKRPAGEHKILITNKMNRAVSYSLSCANPP